MKEPAICRMACFALGVLLSATALGQDGPPIEERAGQARAALTRRAGAIPRERIFADPAAARAALALEKAEMLVARYQASPYRDMLAQRELDKVDGYLEDPASLLPTRGPGFQELAYLSEIDGSAQPYLLYVPTAFDGQTPLPLLVFLHGYAGDLNKVNWIDYMYSPTLQSVCEELGFALLLPYGRSNTEFMGIGESDVLKTIGLVEELIPIDERRVVLSGASMGGSGAYSIACHYPHRFAGVFAVTGRVDYYQWMRVPKDRLPRFKQSQIDMDYAREMLGNLLHVPVFIGHGEHDHLLRVDQSRLMERLLRELGQEVKYVEFEAESHYIWSKTFEHPALRERLERWRAPEAPAKVRFRTYTLKYPRAHWVRIVDIATWGEPADVTAEAKTRGRLEIYTANVAALELKLPPELFDLDGNVEIAFSEGGSAMVQPGPNGTVVGSKTGRGWVWSSPETPKGVPHVVRPRKTPEMCGPAREAYDGPFVIVAPTRPARGLEREAKKARRLAAEWEGYAQGGARVKRDTDITEFDVRDFNLILVGGPETNAYLARIADKLPIRFEKDSYRVGERTFAREGAGVIMAYPNPENPERYVLVREGAQWGVELQINHKLDFLPDFIVFTDEIDRDGTMFETNRHLCAGYFNSAWRLDPASTWTE